VVAACSHALRMLTHQKLRPCANCCFFVPTFYPAGLRCSRLRRSGWLRPAPCSASHPTHELICVHVSLPLVRVGCCRAALLNALLGTPTSTQMCALISAFCPLAVVPFTPQGCAAQG
jgi:hypothetical protein